MPGWLVRWIGEIGQEERKIESECKAPRARG